METKKKPTAAQLKKRLEKAVVHVDQTKDTKSIFFSDKNLRLTVTEDAAIIATGYHRHIFTNFTASGISRPWLYTKRFVEIALENDCQTDDGYSYTKLFETLKNKEDKTEYNLCWFIDLWLFNIFAPLYGIGESEVESFLVYEDYLHNIARNAIILSEKTEPITNKQFIERVCNNLKDFTKDLDENVLFEKKSDDDFIKEETEAIQQNELDQAMETQTNES